MVEEADSVIQTEKSKLQYMFVFFQTFNYGFHLN